MSKKKVIILIIVIVLAIVAFLIFRNSYEKYDDSVNLNYVSLENKKSSVSITSPLSLNDETGRNITSNKNGVNIYYKIKLKSKINKTSNYKILFESDEVTNTIGSNYIKVLLSDKNDKIIKFYDRDSYLTLDSLPLFKDKIVLYTGKLKANDSDEFILRMWISDFYVITNEEQHFSGNVVIYSY